MFKDRLEAIRKGIEETKSRAGLTNEVTIVAVSKRFPLEDIVNAYETTGHTVFGENRIQEALDKASELTKYPDIEIHFIGHIQTNKIKYLKGNFSLIHSVDSVRLAELMQGQFEKIDRVQDVLVQVNIADDENKSGVGAEGVFEICDYVMQADSLI